ncbi:MAG: DNA (cytosine-5-)-methyltransferase [Methanobacteriaceae archaeon]
MLGGIRIKIYNHLAPNFSELEWSMVTHIPQGGNWKNIPESVPSKRLDQIRKSGGRTTYYGRLNNNKPSYTISTYFNRMGNGSYIHPEQDRLISLREGARLQSFRDDFIFEGPKTSQYKQIGNAVPPLLAKVIANCINPFLKNKSFIDLFSGAGGMSQGLIDENFNLCGAIEIEKHFFNTFHSNHKSNSNFILGDIKEKNNQEKLCNINKDIELVVGGPPCQGFSTAGCRNPNDERNKLFEHFVNIVNNIKPKFFVMENVPGLLSMQKGEVLKEIQESFKNIGYYLNNPLKIDAELYGVPQKRKRVFIIGSLENIEIKPPEPLFSYDNSELPNPISVKEAIGGLPVLKAGGGAMVMDEEICTQSLFEEYIVGNFDFGKFYKKAIKTL